MKKFNTFVRRLDFLSPSFYLRFPCINHSTQSFSTSSILAKNKKKRVSDPEAAEIKINKSKSKFIRKAVTKEAESLKKYILNKYSEMIVNYINPLRKQERINFINKKLGLVHRDQLTI